MDFLKKLERALGGLAIRHLTLVLIFGQVVAFLSLIGGRLSPDDLFLVPAAARHQPWRLITFLFLPPTDSVIFVFFSWWMFYLMGSALDGHWGTFRYNLFLFCGWALTVGVAFLSPEYPVSNAFLAGSVFLAFAYLYPDFELAIFFILPVRIKWLALVTWLFYAFSFITGGPAQRLQIFAAVGNFLLFFSRDIWRGARMRGRQMKKQAEDFAHANDARHRCHTCGKTDLTHRDLDFRYCSKCAGDQCYCPEHIFQHEHVSAADEKTKQK
jgi:ribosomal protein L37AE/L43A